MKISIFALLITSATIIQGYTDHPKTNAVIIQMINLMNMPENIAGYMIGEFNALTVGHKASEILKVGENYNAWVRFEINLIGSHIIPDYANQLKFRDIRVIDVKLTAENVQKGMPDDLALLTFVDRNKDYIIQKGSYAQGNSDLFGEGEITVFPEEERDQFLKLTQKYSIYERNDCLQLFSVVVRENQVCGYSTFDNVFLEEFKGAGLLMDKKLMAVAIYEVDGMHEGTQTPFVVFEKVGKHYDFIRVYMHACTSDSSAIRNILNPN